MRAILPRFYLTVTVSLIVAAIVVAKMTAVTHQPTKADVTLDIPKAIDSIYASHDSSNLRGLAMSQLNQNAGDAIANFFVFLGLAIASIFQQFIDLFRAAAAGEESN
ncbi:hypothetical protein EON65_42030 [archaeon]|nr:MAG: hypothetical protein EON65_42030 [archaeon]